MTQLIPVAKHDVCIDVHPDALAEHLALGWSRVERFEAAHDDERQDDVEAFAQLDGHGAEPVTQPNRRGRPPKA